VEPSLVGAAVGTATEVIEAVVVLLPGDGCVGAGFLDATLLPGDGFGGVFGGGFLLWSTAGGACFADAALFLAAASCFFVGLFGLPLAIFEFMDVANKKVGKG
jgi:hypothetical protein